MCVTKEYCVCQSTHVRDKRTVPNEGESMKYKIRRKLGQKKAFEIVLNILFQTGLFLLVWLVVEKCPCIKGYFATRTYIPEKHNLNYCDVIIAQFSTSFIVISLTSILSSNSKVILWVDRIDLELKQFGIGSFVAHSVRIFTSLIISIVLFVMTSDYIYANFLISVVVTMWFMYDLVKVNFDDNSIHKKLDKYYDFIKNNQEKLNTTDEYKSILRSFETQTAKYISEHDIESFYVNIKFLEGKEEWGTIGRIFYAIDENNIFVLSDFFESLISEDENKRNNYKNKLGAFWKKIKSDKENYRYKALSNYMTTEGI